MPAPVAYAWHMPQNDSPPRHVRLFRNGRNQAIRIPRDMELAGDEAVIRKEGGRLIIEPAKPDSLLAFLEGLEPLDEEIGHVEDPPPDPVDL